MGDNGETRAQQRGGRKKGNKTRPHLQYDDKKKLKNQQRRKIVKEPEALRIVPLFEHLRQQDRSLSVSAKLGFDAPPGPVGRPPEEDKSSDIHPAVLRLGLKLSEGQITGSYQSVCSLLEAFKSAIADYRTPKNVVLCLDLNRKVQKLVQFVVDCKDLTIPMGNAVRFLKLKISQVDAKMEEAAAKEELIEAIDSYLSNRVLLAQKVIAEKAALRVDDGDVILVYSRSSALYEALKIAHQRGTNFRVIVVDSRPHMQGKLLVNSLVALGIQVTYCLLSSISYVMNEATKVFLGAHAMLSNGALVSRIGGACVATVAKASNVPVLVLCETYKFSERVQIDSICFNEVGDPDEIVRTDLPEVPRLEDWREYPNLHVLHLKYDVTPSNLLGMVVTEIGCIPPSSVPVILREHETDIEGN